MLSRLKQLIDPRTSATSDALAPSRRLELATAALLIEVMRSDGASDTEREAVEAALRHRFGLSVEEADALIADAEAEVRDAVGYYPFTSLINRHFTAADKERIVGMLWQIAYADATLSAHEQHVMRKLADLLHVSHASYIAAKLRARDG